LEEGTRASSPLIQLVDTDSDDCIVLDGPARSEPEVITLDSDDDDVVQISIQTCQPSTSTSTSQPRPSTSQRPVRLKRNWLTVNKVQLPSASSGSENNNSCPSTSQRPVRLKRNWLTVNQVQVPSTSSGGNIDGCEISISIAHPSRSLSPTGSESSSTSWEPVRRKPTKVKKKKDTVKKGKCHKGKTSQPMTKVKGSNREGTSSPDPVVRRRKTKPRAVTSSSSEDSRSSRTHKVDQKPFKNELQKRNLSVRSSESSDSDSGSDRMFVAMPRCKMVFADSSTSSDEMEYKPRLKSVVVKTEPQTNIKPEPPELQTTSYFSSHSRSESYDHNLDSSPHRYSELPGSSRSRSDSYRSSYSYRSHRSPSSSVERLSNKRCKHSRKRAKKEK
jgi:hypothetical protein